MNAVFHYVSVQRTHSLFYKGKNGGEIIHDGSFDKKHYVLIRVMCNDVIIFKHAFLCAMQARTRLFMSFALQSKMQENGQCGE